MDRLKNLVELRSGYQLRGAARHQPGGGHPLIQLGDVREDGIAFDSLVRMDLDRPRPKDIVAAGDLLLRGRGASYRAMLLRDCPPGSVAAAPLYIARVRSHSVLPEYLAWWINRPATQAALVASARGSYIPSVSLETFAELEVLVPPIAEQEQAVRIDALVREERRLQGRLSQARERLIAELLDRSLGRFRE